MRISEADFKRLNRDIKGTKAKPTKASEALVKAIKGEDAAPKRAKGKNREARADYGRKTVKFRIELPADPQPKERPRTVINAQSIVDAFVKAHGSVAKFRELIKGRTSHTYTPKNTADYEDLIKTYATVAMAEAKLKPFTCPVKTHVHVVFAGDPGTWPTSPGDGDADNLEKAVLDALNGIVYADDRLVVTSFRSKSCGPKPLLVVRVSPANG